MIKRDVLCWCEVCGYRSPLTITKDAFIIGLAHKQGHHKIRSDVEEDA